MGEPEPLDEILINALRVAAELHLILDPGAMLFAGRAGFFGCPSRWPGWGSFPLGNPTFSAAGAGGHPGGIWRRGRLCLTFVATNRLAIHPGQAFDFTLAATLAQQRFYRNS
jgi:hypothetical protein